MFRTICLLFLILGTALSSPLHGQETKQVTLRLAGERGPSYTGSIEEAGPDLIRLQLEGGGSITLKTGRLDWTSIQHVYHHLRSQLDPENPLHRLQLGDFCLQHSLFAFAEENFRAIANLDSEQAKLSRKRLERCQRAWRVHELQTALEDLEAGRNSDAADRLEKLTARSPETEEGRAALRLLPEIRRKIEKEKPPPPSKPGEDRKKTKSRTGRIIEKIEQEISKARSLHSRGLALEAKHRETEGARAYQAGIDLLEHSQSTCKTVAHALSSGRLRGTPDEVEKLRTIERAIGRLQLTLYLALAHHHATARRLNQARRFTNYALSIDPSNPTALALRNQITEEILRHGSK